MSTDSNTIPSQLTVTVTKANIDFVDLSICHFIKLHKCLNYDSLKKFTNEFGEIMNEVKKIITTNPQLTFKLQVEVSDTITIKVIQ